MNKRVSTKKPQRRAVLVTGAAGGLGAAVVQELAQNGYTVYAADIKAGAAASNVNWVYMDVANEASVVAAYGDVVKALCETGDASLCALIHLAGIYVMDSLVEIDDTVMQRMVDVNLLGAYRVNRVFLPLILKGRGRIVIVSSELAPLKPLPFNGIYSITKTALDCYAHSLMMELSLHDIKVITLRPGAFGTGMPQAALASMENMMQKSKLYPNNAERYRKIMLGETNKARNTAVFARKTVKILEKRKPRYKYAIGNSIKLWLVSALPTGVQAYIFKKLLG